jgi:superfamily II DNA or RNA helicase
MTEFKPGKLVTFREREWIVQPSSDPELLALQPMGGSEEEATAVFLPLESASNVVREARFPNPEETDIDDFASAKMLFNATRLSFRNASGPFRCMGKLSFRPRSYQVVPLVMALRQDQVRLLIADDVGIGKTVEALMILKEMMERGEVKRFAVICLPHLCEQWQQELKDKLDIDAEIIRSSTAAALDRKLPDDRSVFYHLPYQVISIDYIKSDKRSDIFLNDCPELVIVDEAHSCAKPKGAKSNRQQLRYNLLRRIVDKRNPHLLLLTATPHSGKDEEFQSLLGLLNKDFEVWNLAEINQNQRKKLAQHFVQRKRENIARWHRAAGDEKTPFPKRDPKEIGYQLTDKYKDFYKDILAFARGISQETEARRSTRIRYWAALALLRGIMSSPAAAIEMLNNRQQRRLDDDDLGVYQLQSNPLIEADAYENDNTPVELIDNSELAKDELNELNRLASLASELSGVEADAKLKKTVQIIKQWIKEKYQPIIFCKYISTAHYIGEILKQILPGKVDVQVVTSELADEQRRERIAAMSNSSQRVLVATDCLSEGINLQHLFTAVLHYDLPWNPNRIEQREGRVDRFGQEAEIVKTWLLWGEDNPIDQIVLRILIQKVRDIQKATGVSITLGEDNQSIMDTVIRDILLGTETKADDGRQMQLFAEEMITNELELARQKAENLRSIFAHESISPEAIEADLKEVDEAIGDLHSVEAFVCAAIIHLGGSVEKSGEGFVFTITNLPEHLKVFFPSGRNPRVSFISPTPAGYYYLGRNHRFVEQLCQFILGLAFESHPEHKRVARASVIRTGAVSIKTTLIQFRVRNVIRESNSRREIISEEMYLWGYEGSGSAARTLNYEGAKNLLLTASSSQQVALPMQKQAFRDEMTVFSEREPVFHKLAVDRANNLVDAHGRFKSLVGGKRYEAVYPVLPPDVIGFYILIPTPQDLF